MSDKRNWKFWTKRLMLCLVFCFMVMAVSGIGMEFVQAASVDDLMYERTFSVQSTKGYTVATGNHSLETHGNGNALYLDGEDDFLKVTTVDGAPLLTGYEEITVSYQAKAEYASENWTFYAAPNDDQQIYPQEKYIAILDKNQSVIAERFNNQTGRPEAATVTFATDEWYYMTVVYGRTDTVIYLNGEEVAREASTYDLPGILGNNSILYISKGNWNGGEYYKGLIDNYTITGRALSAEEVAAAYKALQAQSPVE